MSNNKQKSLSLGLLLAISACGQAPAITTEERLRDELTNLQFSSPSSETCFDLRTLHEQSPLFGVKSLEGGRSAILVKDGIVYRWEITKGYVKKVRTELINLNGFCKVRVEEGVIALIIDAGGDVAVHTCGGFAQAPCPPPMFPPPYQPHQ